MGYVYTVAAACLSQDTTDHTYPLSNALNPEIHTVLISSCRDCIPVFEMCAGMDGLGGLRNNPARPCHGGRHTLQFQMEAVLNQ